MFSVKMLYLTVPIAALLVTKLVTEYQFGELLRHFLFSKKQLLHRHYSEFEILRFTSSL